MADYLNIAGRVRTTASDGVAMEAQEVKDLNQNKSQQEINADVQTELGDRYTKEETYSKEQVNDLITTPDANYVNVVATNATTAVTDILPATGETNTIYRVGNWNGTQYDPTMYALFAWNGSAYVCLAVRSFVGEVYDVSVNHPDGQGNPTPYADLDAALGTDGANIPADIRRGGMRIQFIQGTVHSSDNKYVCYMLTKNTWSIQKSDWIDITYRTEFILDAYINVGAHTIEPSNNSQCYCMKAVEGRKYKAEVMSDAPNVATKKVAFVDENYNILSDYSFSDSKRSLLLTADAGTAYIFVCYNFQGDGSLSNIDVYEYVSEFETLNTNLLLKENLSNKTNTLSEFNAISQSKYPTEALLYNCLDKVYLKAYIGASAIDYSATSLTLRLKVTPGKKYKIKYTDVSISHYCVFTSNGTGTFVGNRFAATVGDTIVTAPNDAQYLFCCVIFTGTGNINWVDVKEYTVIDENNDAIISGSKNDLDQISEHKQSPNLFDKSQTQIHGYVDSNGGYSTSSKQTYCTHLIPILPNHYYYLNGRSELASVAVQNIRCLDGSNNSLKVLIAATNQTYGSWALPSEDGTNAVYNGQFKTPEGAEYIQFNWEWDGTGDTDSIMLVDLGTDYIPNYPAPDYEPYGQVTIIKQSALPSDIYGALEKIPAIEDNAKNAVSRNFRLKVLLVGSSHGMNTIAQLPWICNNSTNKLNVEVGNVYIGSFSLQRLVGMNERGEKCELKYFKDGEWSTINNKSFSEVFGYADWDFICLQRSASDDDIWLTTQNAADVVQNPMTNINYDTALTPVYMSHNDALQYVLNLIRTNVTKNAEVIFNSGFADPSEGIESTQTTVISSTAEDMREQFGIDVVPVAIAVRNARNTYLRYIGNYQNGIAPNTENNLCYDAQHLDYGIGCYVASMCLLEFICRKIGWDITNLDGFGSQAELYSFNSNVTSEKYTQPTEETMIVAKACAKCACNTPDSVSAKLQSRFKWKITYNLSSGVTASNDKGYSSDSDKYVTTFAGSVSSVVIKSRTWDRSQTQTTLIEGTDYTYDTSTQTLVILSVQGDIEIITT